MPKPPLIGITTHSRNSAGEVLLPGTYIDAIQTAGGNALLLPPNQPDPEALLNVLDGLVFSGGGDINPILYGGENHLSIYGIDEDRDAFELTLAKAALIRKIPVLGICRGMQVLAIAAGGELVAHVPDVYGDAIAHRLDHPRRPINHDLSILPNTRLAHLLETTTLNIVSWHHQAVKTVPQGWQISAQADDGLLEAIEHVQHPWMVAVQWHPELSGEDPAHQRLFHKFVEVAGKEQ
ncbi:MAG: gamma-glutamyl-gamma-aminobutyrate hydrolase family protein [Myxacorys chilensis ATA2-1-KO14]|jgi:putative glutamine amidotransferase|nr:gamma-glutamyl-gamma-aminobutyrate hydrolase family protein [Myxacorys chilensis ATA2-1-KO14]